MLSPVKMAITADNQTGAAFKAVEAGLNEIRRAARGATSAMATMRGAASDGTAMANAMASMYGLTAQKATTAAGSTGVFSKAVGLASRAFLPLTAAMTAYDALNLAQSIARDTYAMNDAAKVAQVSTVSLSQYGHVAKMTGTDLGSITTALKQSSRALSEARDPTSQAAEMIRDLGLNVQTLRSMSPDAAFEEIGQAIAALPSEFDRTNASLRLLGRSGNETLPMFKNGAAGVRELKAEADRLGVTLNSGTAVAFGRAADASDRMRASFTSLVREMMTDALPAVEASTNAFTNALVGSRVARQFDRANRETEVASPEIRARFVEIWRKEGMLGAVAYWTSWKSEAENLTKNGGIFAGIMERPQLPGQTSAGLEATRLQLQAEGRKLQALVKSTATADIDFGLTDESLTRVRDAAVQYERVAAAVQDAAHVEWLGEQMGPTDRQAAEEAAASMRAHDEWLRQATEEYRRLKTESTTTWRLTAAGVENVTDQLSYNMSAALTGIRTQLLDLNDLARGLLNLALRMGLDYLGGKLMSSIFKTGAGATAGLQGPGIDGVPIGKSLASSAGRTSGGTTINFGDIHVRGILDPTDKLSARRVAAALYDELETVSGHVGPRGAAA